MALCRFSSIARQGSIVAQHWLWPFGVSGSSDHCFRCWAKGGLDEAVWPWDGGVSYSGGRDWRKSSIFQRTQRLNVLLWLWSQRHRAWGRADPTNLLVNHHISLFWISKTSGKSSIVSSTTAGGCKRDRGCCRTAASNGNWSNVFIEKDGGFKLLGVYQTWDFSRDLPPFGNVTLRANTSICPRLLAAIFVCAENVIKKGVFLHHGCLHVVYRHAQHRDLCDIGNVT